MAKLPEPKRPPFLPPNWKEVRAELCRRVDFLALLAQDGVAVKKSGDHYVASLRPADKTPSCHIYPPGTGGRRLPGWTFKDFGADMAGDALGYLVDVRGMDFADAIRFLADSTGYWPPELDELKKQAPGCPRNDSKAPTHTGTPPKAAAIPRAEKPPLEATALAPEAQALACRIYLDNLLAVHPEAQAEGDAYLARRGTLPAGLPPCAYEQPAAKSAALLERIRKGDAVELLVEAGLLKPPEDGKGLRLQWGHWAGDVVLLAHLDPEARPVAFIARRLDFRPGDEYGKYLQQTYKRGAVRWPFGLPTIYLPPCVSWKPARDKADQALLVEGTLDALGAAVLGWPALAFSKRPEARNWKTWTGSCARMLDPHLPELRRRRIRVVPDNDPGEKGDTGQQLAARLVGALRAVGCTRAEVSTMKDLLPDLPPECKDLGDAAKLKGSMP